MRLAIHSLSAIDCVDSLAGVWWIDLPVEGPSTNKPSDLRCEAEREVTQGEDPSLGIHSGPLYIPLSPLYIVTRFVAPGDVELPACFG